ncbi:MAG: hypothetical protein Q8O85_16575 [Rhodoferax sp.]|uniref:hypothetical protein n=1 Tax=Rhodoferax sp. TaxID=50421 RepID=UPI00273264B2|nr:hypothetical protein [Rhodoferax sp.]MDP2680317.1 hypothetical protein [Rhodoferax sp.]
MKQQSQAAIGRALGLSPASMSKLKGMGMPIDSVEAARAWRRDNIKPTMNGRPGDRLESQTSRFKPSGAVERAQALLDIAASALVAGHSLDSMVPVLRAALHAIPACERDGTMLLPVNVMDVLVADVVALLPVAATPGTDGSHQASGDSMGDEEAAYMGRFWYEVAAGEIAATAPGRVPG